MINKAIIACLAFIFASAAIAACGGGPQVPVNFTAPAILGAASATVGTPLVAVPGQWTNPDRVSIPIDGTYGLVFDEEFNGTSLDFTKWTPNWFGTTTSTVTPPVVAFPTEVAAYDPAQISVLGGFATLSTINNPITISSVSYTYRTGHFDSNPSSGTTGTGPGFAINPTAGNPVYLEARIFIPSDGAGNVVNWPSALITFGQNWPVTGEIDVAEGLNQGALPVAGMTANYHSTPGAQNSGVFANHYTGWHVFAAVWTTTTVTYYYDGVQVEQYTTGIASAPNYIMLQNAMGTTNGGNSVAPATMLADYIHVYLKNATPIASQANYQGPGATFTGGYTYSWVRDGATVVGTGQTYTPAAGDGGGTHTLTVTVSASNSMGQGTGVASAATRTIP